MILAKAIKELVDDKAQYTDWAARDDIKSQLNNEALSSDDIEQLLDEADEFTEFTDKRYTDEKEPIDELHPAERPVRPSAGCFYLDGCEIVDTG